MFKIELISKSSGTTRSPDLPTQDIDLALGEVCQNAQDAGELDFVIEGFGRRWPVDVSTDFKIFLEQLPELKGSLSGQMHDGFHLSFFEQGIESDLFIQRKNEDLVIECTCWGNWIPNPKVETLPVRDFEQMTNDLTDTLFEYVEDRYPQLFSEPGFQAWAKTVR